jgi:tetratricopeptide (TPR) repeat protein
MELGRYDDALRLVDRARAVEERTIGPESGQVASLFGIRAYILARSGDPRRALVDYRRAIELTQALRGADDHFLIGLYEDQAEAQRAAGDRAGARASLRRAREIRERATR